MELSLRMNDIFSSSSLGVPFSLSFPLHRLWHAYPPSLTMFCRGLDVEWYYICIQQSSWSGRMVWESISEQVGFPLAFKAPYSHSLSNASFEPGGWLEDPVLSTSLLLDLTITPRMNIYIASDDYASFIIDARISYIHGEPFYNTSYDIKPTSLAPSPLSSST